MSTQYPQIAGYTGTFSGSPVSINIQADHGWVAQQVVATGTADMTLSFPTGNALSIPAGIALVFGGPVNEMTLTGTVGQKYTVYASAVAGTFSVTGSSSGGGGGGGAPTTAPYLLNGDTVPGSLTSATAIGALAATLDFKRPTLGTGAVTPIQLEGSKASAPADVSDGVALPFKWTSNAGTQTVAQIGAAFIDVTDPAHPQGALVVALGADETGALFLTKDELTVPAKISTAFPLTVQSGTDMTLTSNGGKGSIVMDCPAGFQSSVVISNQDVYPNDLVRCQVGTAYMQVARTLINNHSATLHCNDASVGVGGPDAGNCVISLRTISNLWRINANGSLESVTIAAPIHNIADGTLAGDAAACGQFLTGVATVLAGQNTVTVAVNAKFNGKSVRCGLSGIPGGAIAATPVLFSGTVAAGTLTISVVDVTTGALLAGGVTTNTDVTYDSFAF